MTSGRPDGNAGDCAKHLSDDKVIDEVLTRSSNSWVSYGNVLTAVCVSPLSRPPAPDGAVRVSTSKTSSSSRYVNVDRSKAHEAHHGVMTKEMQIAYAAIGINAGMSVDAAFDLVLELAEKNANSADDPRAFAQMVLDGTKPQAADPWVTRR